jgi:hypothetical protein
MKSRQLASWHFSMSLSMKYYFSQSFHDIRAKFKLLGPNMFPARSQKWPCQMWLSRCWIGEMIRPQNQKCLVAAKASQLAITAVHDPLLSMFWGPPDPWPKVVRNITGPGLSHFLINYYGHTLHTIRRNTGLLTAPMFPVVWGHQVPLLGMAIDD